jgi:hypothetical protein
MFEDKKDEFKVDEDKGLGPKGGMWQDNLLIGGKSVCT